MHNNTGFNLLEGLILAVPFGIASGIAFWFGSWLGKTVFHFQGFLLDLCAFGVMFLCFCVGVLMIWPVMTVKRWIEKRQGKRKG